MTPKFLQGLIQHTLEVSGKTSNELSLGNSIQFSIHYVNKVLWLNANRKKAWPLPSESSQSRAGDRHADL